MWQFLQRQFSYWWQAYPYREPGKSTLRVVAEAGYIPVGYLRWRWHLTRAAAMPGGQKCTVVLLSHNRPQNTPLLVRSALQCDFVEQVIVSNSNRTVRLADWVKETDPRLVLVDETKPTRPGYRFELAAQSTGQYFLAIDDDLFLTPRQMAILFRGLLANEQVAHGIQGQNYWTEKLSPNGSPFHHVGRFSGKVDVLIGVYAFTRAHVERLREMAAQLKLPPLQLLANGEDILLSLVSAGSAEIHVIGRVYYCMSNALPGVALSKTHNDFWAERVRIYLEARSLRDQKAALENVRS